MFYKIAPNGHKVEILGYNNIVPIPRLETLRYNNAVPMGLKKIEVHITPYIKEEKCIWKLQFSADGKFCVLKNRF